MKDMYYVHYTTGWYLRERSYVFAAKEFRDYKYLLFDILIGERLYSSYKRDQKEIDLLTTGWRLTDTSWTVKIRRGDLIGYHV